MAVRMGINGFGRIGRLVFRAGMENQGVTMAAINEPFMDLEYMIYMLKYDSVHKKFNGTISSKKDGDKYYLIVNGMPVRIFHSKDPAHWLGRGQCRLRVRVHGCLHSAGESDVACQGWLQKGYHFRAPKGRRSDVRHGRES